MGRFKELGQNKTQILMKLLENDDIVKCLVDNQKNFLDTTLPDDFDRTSLIYSQIYPYRFIPKTQTEPKTFITTKYGYKPSGTTYKNGSIYFYVITHNSLIRTDYGMLRYDFLVNKIDEVFNSLGGIGIGNLTFYDMDELPVNEDYSGVYIAYKAVDFQ